MKKTRKTSEKLCFFFVVYVTKTKSIAKTWLILLIRSQVYTKFGLRLEEKQAVSYIFQRFKNRLKKRLSKK